MQPLPEDSAGGRTLLNSVHKHSPSKLKELELFYEETSTLPPEKRTRLEGEPTEIAKDGTEWREEQLGPHLHFTPIEAYDADGEPTAKARRSIGSRLQSFLCFITLDMLRRIQQWTNQHARQTEQVDWFMDLPELKAFIAVIILRGVTHVPSLRDSWSANLGNPHIIATMARNRFQNIMQHLRFDDRFTRNQRAEIDRFAAISDVWGSFVNNCISSYNPGRHITINEQLFPSKTRCTFLQYIASKPDKFGIKFWVACDLKSKYICNVLPYLGKDPSRPSGERLSESVVMKLMEPFMDKGRTVTTDNFFTSLSLAQRLRSRRTSILGTVNKIRREIPQSTRQKDQAEFTTRVFSTPEATLTVYAPKRKKMVYVLSSMHTVIENEDTPKKKPNTACTGVQERRVDFLIELAKELAKSHVSAKKAHKEEVYLQQPLTPSPGKRAKCQVPGEPVQEELKRRGLQLADFPLESTEGPELALLIGADYYWHIVSGKIQRIINSLVAIESSFGWALQGPVSASSLTDATCMHISVSEGAQISKQLHAFWNMESPGIVDKGAQNSEEAEALSHFEQTLAYKDGRYRVELPRRSEGLISQTTTELQRDVLKALRGD
ncbi:uncharacterized protein LOC121647490 [Melanotaenia boesemani]|uniref:uncharacterized protein LOC121647490 n=1 Tax=Melanotaenia boesemani TaxID=1250792 RepID=UPI001C047FD7|nr:uncharacterized protein LOC121647490 [Melanotaenia boesemani]